MILNELKLSSFKNYSNLSAEFNEKFNFIFGDNGNGKTNLLESISFLCLTKSFLSSTDSECVQYGEEKYSIEGRFNGEVNDLKIDCFYSSDIPSKKLLLNNEKVKKYSEIIGKLPVIILSPKDFKIVTGNPQERRRNFDIILSQNSRLYLDHMRNYLRILDQRNVLLKDHLVNKKYSRSDLIDLLEPWSQKLVEHGSEILLKRIEFTNNINRILSDLFKKISSSDTFPSINYRMFGREILLTDEYSKEEINSLFKDELDRVSNTELARGISLAGPHRDDYIIYLFKHGNRFEMKHSASQGEQKVFLISLKFAEYYFLKERMELKGKDEPILLLDDIFSELDLNKINNISAIFADLGQIFFTTTNHDYYYVVNKTIDPKDISVFKVENGQASKIN